jgi:hypothetical protein
VLAVEQHAADDGPDDERDGRERRDPDRAPDDEADHEEQEGGERHDDRLRDHLTPEPLGPGHGTHRVASTLESDALQGLDLGGDAGSGELGCRRRRAGTLDAGPVICPHGRPLRSLPPYRAHDIAPRGRRRRSAAQATTDEERPSARRAFLFACARGDLNPHALSSTGT